jgi:hypothetical protein
VKSEASGIVVEGLTGFLDLFCVVEIHVLETSEGFGFDVSIESECGFQLLLKCRMSDTLSALWTFEKGEAHYSTRPPIDDLLTHALVVNIMTTFETNTRSLTKSFAVTNRTEFISDAVTNETGRTV